MRRPMLLWSLVAAPVSTVGCGGGGDITGPARVAAVNVIPADWTLNVGQTAEFTAAARDAGGRVLPGKSFTFISSNRRVATVAHAAPDRATVTAVGAGSTTIIAITEGQSGGTNLTVLPRPDKSRATPPPAART